MARRSGRVRYAPAAVRLHGRLLQKLITAWCGLLLVTFLVHGRCIMRSAPALWSEVMLACSIGCGSRPGRSIGRRCRGLALECRGQQRIKLPIARRSTRRVEAQIG